MAATLAILNFRSERFSSFWPTCHPDAAYCFKSIGLSVQEEKWKIDFQDGRHGTLPVGLILASFDLQITLMLPTKFQVNWPFGSGGEAKNRFSRWPPRWTSWISDRNDFSYIWSMSHPDSSYRVSSQLAFWFRRRSKKIDFQDGRYGHAHRDINSHSGHLGFPNGMILTIFDLQVTPMLPLAFQDKWTFISGEEAKHWFPRQRPRRPSWISDRNNCSYFWLTSHPDASYQVSSQLAFWFRRRSEK